MSEKLQCSQKTELTIVGQVSVVVSYVKVRFRFESGIRQGARDDVDLELVSRRRCVKLVFVGIASAGEIRT